jgi:hypothetical protein
MRQSAKTECSAAFPDRALRSLTQKFALLWRNVMTFAVGVAEMLLQ